VTDASELARRVQALEDLEAIKRSKAAYCHLSDRGYNGAGDDPAAVAALFDRDGAWGSARGQGAIRELFTRFQRELPFAVHYAINPSVELDGDTARASWHGLVAATTDAGQALWIGGRYDDRFVRTENGWRFARLDFQPAFRTPRDGG
jgi:SnoaL-like domain